MKIRLSFDRDTENVTLLKGFQWCNFLFKTQNQGPLGLLKSGCFDTALYRENGQMFTRLIRFSYKIRKLL